MSNDQVKQEDDEPARTFVAQWLGRFDVREISATKLAALLTEFAATVRREVWNAAIKIAKAEVFERRSAHCVYEALIEASANQKGEVNG